jgi:two-component sensor histidine kinase
VSEAVHFPELCRPGFRSESLGFYEGSAMAAHPPTYPDPAYPDIGLSLSMAMVASSNAPLLLLDGALNVIAASTSFCGAFDIDPAGIPGHTVFELGAGEWDVPRLRSLLNAAITGQTQMVAYEMDLHRAGLAPRRLVLNAQKLDYGEGEQVRLLLTISDVTDARINEKLREALLHEKTILLQEVQHRVANSLQIIASVLMQSARRINSEEIRGHLHDAHSRVMSIASVQRQLAVSADREVVLHSYLTQLCQSLGASMIRDHNHLLLIVTADKSIVDADISVSLGLIVTELVINALKHAFPAGRPGRITVDYRAEGEGWRLSVSDNGVGILKGPEESTPKPGLGTSIVEALARRLDADVAVSDLQPGTEVAITQTPLAAIFGPQESTQATVAI